MDRLKEDEEDGAFVSVQPFMTDNGLLVLRGETDLSETTQVMDERASMQISKRNKSLNGQSVGQGKDRISTLPDNVLHYILSILPTKHAVATSVLSTEWKYLWTSVSKLQFCDHKESSGDPMVKTNFLNFVNRVLLLHNVSSIRKFDLSCNEQYDASHINAWITTVVMRKVQELILSLSLNQPIVFPRCVFDCDSLTTLKIIMDCQLTVPTSVRFPHLKVLHLESVTLYSDHSTQHVCFSFPVLEEFSADEVRWLKIKNVEISAPSLKRLIIFDLRYDHLQSCEIHIFAQNLVFLDFTSHLVCEYILHKSSTLADAIVRTCNATNDIGHRVVKLLSSLYAVKSLCLSKFTTETFISWDTSVDLPTFSCLIDLRVDVEGDDTNVVSMMNLLHKMPNIESLIFDGTCVIYEEYWAPEIIPQCIQSKLKFVELEYTGGEFELRVVKFLLKKAAVLEEMTLLSSRELSGDPKKHVEVSKELLKLPRASTFCVINLL